MGLRKFKNCLLVLLIAGTKVFADCPPETFSKMLHLFSSDEDIKVTSLGYQVEVSKSSSWPNGFYEPKDIQKINGYTVEVDLNNYGKPVIEKKEMVDAKQVLSAHDQFVNSFFSDVEGIGDYDPRTIRASKKVDQQVANYRKHLTVIHDAHGKTIAMSRLVDGNVDARAYWRLNSAAIQLVPLRDGNYKLPLERIVEELGAKTHLVDQYRFAENPYQVIELGESYGELTGRGEQGKAIWLVHNLVPEFISPLKTNKIVYFIYTSKILAPHFAEVYGAKIRQAVVLGEKSAKIINTSKVLKRKSDYLLTLTWQDLVDHVVLKYKTEAKFKAAIDHSPSLTTWYQQLQKYYSIDSK